MKNKNMKALVYLGPGKLSLNDHPKPILEKDTDAIIKMSTTTICGTDLHILKGDVSSVKKGRVLGHEGIGVVDQVGSGVKNFKTGDRVVISVNTSCGRCRFCKKGIFSHCVSGGWLLGNTIDGTQAEYVRVPFADTGLSALSKEDNEDSAIMLSCILPTGMECGAMSSHLQPGESVAIVGAGPVGLSVLLAVKLYSPSMIIMVDIDDHRLAIAKNFGASKIINNKDGKAVERVLAMTGGEGVDVAIEAVGLPDSFDICQNILAYGGRLANLGVHGKSVELHLENLWSSNVTLTTNLVNGSSTPLLLKMIQSGVIDSKKLVSHRFAFLEIMKAYETFLQAAVHHALKVVIQFG